MGVNRKGEERRPIVHILLELPHSRGEHEGSQVTKVHAVATRATSSVKEERLLLLVASEDLIEFAVMERQLWLVKVAAFIVRASGTAALTGERRTCPSGAEGVACGPSTSQT